MWSIDQGEHHHSTCSDKALRGARRREGKGMGRNPTLVWNGLLHSGVVNCDMSDGKALIT